MTTEELDKKRDQYQDDMSQLIWLMKKFMPTLTEPIPKAGAVLKFPKHNSTVVMFLYKKGYVTEMTTDLQDTSHIKYWATIKPMGVEAIEFHRNRKIMLSI